jgi:hypothetical protein
VTSAKDQKQYWDKDEHKYQYHPIEKFAASFRQSYLPGLIQDNIFVPKTKRSNDVEKISSTLSRWNVFKACFLREILLFKRNSALHIVTSLQMVVLALVISTIFLRTNMTQKSVLDANKYNGAIFLALTIVNFNGMIEVAMMIKRLPTFYKQRELLALPGWALLSPAFLISVPISVVQTGLWTLITYYLIGYAPSFIR